MSLDERLTANASSITPAERLVAEVVVADRELVAFGTVAQVAARAGSSGASVVRLADRLGFAGFKGMQEAVQAELSGRLRPAVEKIRRPAAGDLLSATAAAAAAAVHSTLGSVDRSDWERAIGFLARRRNRVLVLSGDAGAGVARQAVTHLSMLRDGVGELGGSTVAVGRQLAGTAAGDVVLCVDLPRHDRWVLDAVSAARGRGLTVLAVADSPLSPLAGLADVAFAAAAPDVGPFDSYVAVLALVEALVAAVAARLKGSAVEHLDSVESLWHDTGALDDTD